MLLTGEWGLLDVLFSQKGTFKMWRLIRWACDSQTENCCPRDTGGRASDVLTEHSNVCAIPTQKIVVPETQGTEVDVLTEHCEGRVIPATETDVPEKQEGEDLSGKEHSDGRVQFPNRKLLSQRHRGQSML